MRRPAWRVSSIDIQNRPLFMAASMPLRTDIGSPGR